MFSRSIFWMLALGGLLLVLILTTLFAVGNQINDLERMRAAGGTPTTLGTKVAEAYEALERLDMTVETTYYWYRQGSLSSRIPLALFPTKNYTEWLPVTAKRAFVALDSTRDRYDLKIYDEWGKADRSLVYHILLNDGELTESFFQDEILKETVEYPFDPKKFPMTRETDGRLICATAYNVPHWIGPEADQPRDFERLINDGVEIGRLKDQQGEPCRVVATRYNESNNTYFFLIDRRHFVSEWWIITEDQDQDRYRNRFLLRQVFSFSVAE